MRTITFDTRVHDGVIKIPEKYQNLETKDIEVILVVKDNDTDKFNEAKKPVNKARGILRRYKNSDLITKEKTAWGIAVKEKYDHR